MKVIIIALLLLKCCLSFAQTDTLLTFSKVVMIDSASKTQLYERARHWFNDYFKSSKAVLQVSDKESGELIGKPILYTWYNYHYFGADHKIQLDMPVTIRVLIKDGKYKYEVYDITTSYSSTVNAPYGSSKELFGALTTSDICPHTYPMIRQKKINQNWNDVKKNAADMIDLLAASLNKYMTDKGAISKDDF